MLDGLDGRVARAMRAQSRFGAELDSLSDAISFGVAPALILYLWSLQQAPQLGWIAALALAVCCALRLARFNAQIDMEHQPHKSAGFLTGVPAPMGAGLALMPLYLWIASHNDVFRNPYGVAAWTVIIAFLMISNTATLGWTGLRPRRAIRLEVIGLSGLVFAALLIEHWWTLVGLCLVYIALLPVGVLRYRRIRQQHAAARPGQAPAA
jgi:CDP-diacylglycerol--serine O-phosphatidyltransferase